jgi:hypothetical protein
LGELDLRVVVYERLLEEFDAEVRSLADYLEVKFSPAAIARIRNAVEFDKLQIADPGHLRSGVTGEWVGSLSEEQKSIARRIAGPMFRILGYPVHAGDASSPEVPDASMSRELRQAVELSRGTVRDKVHYAASLLRSRRPVGEKIRKALAFLLRT